MLNFTPVFSPNYAKQMIPVEFLILHYTACSLHKTLSIFNSLAGGGKTCTHLIIDPCGKVFENTPCLKGKCFKAFHAGKSQLKETVPASFESPTHPKKDKKNPHPVQKIWRDFNNFSLGVELVNYNGNLFNYTREQYQTLGLLLKKLKNLYPALKNPHRIFGHEHIAGFRGKIDPGHKFNWPLFFKTSYPSHSPPSRVPALSQKNLKTFSPRGKKLLQLKKTTDRDWMALNSEMEKQHTKLYS